MTPPPDHPAGALPDPDPRGDVPVEEIADERELPRRAASAEFVVESDVGSHALLREAMDPANQSLADALRLSFRVLQIVILVLIVLFVFSGFQTVEEGQSGVLLRWGKILTVDGSQALEPGLKFSRWPYPAGEFVLFDDKGRTVDVGRAFWPGMRGAESFEEAVQSATVNQHLRPPRDGSVLTQGGDIAHIRLGAVYDVDGPDRFVHAVENASADPRRLDADRLVRLSLERAIVHAAARRTLREFVDLADDGEADLRGTAQTMLDRVESGIRVVSVETPVDPTPALAIKKAYGELQEARVRAREVVEIARQDARKTLLAVAGHTYPAIVNLLGQYEDAYELGDTEGAEALLGRINERLESPETSGQVAAVLSFANSYRSTIERTLGREAERFESLIGAYRKHPDYVVAKLWQEAYASVLERQDAELIYAPADGGALTIAISGQNRIREERRRNRLERSTREALLGGLDLENPYIRRGRDMREGPGRQLSETGGSLNRRR